MVDFASIQLSDSDVALSKEVFDLKFEINEYKNQILQYTDCCLIAQYYTKRGAMISSFAVNRQIHN